MLEAAEKDGHPRRFGKVNVKNQKEGEVMGVVHDNNFMMSSCGSNNWQPLLCMGHRRAAVFWILQEAIG